MPLVFWERYAVALLVTGAALAALYACGAYFVRRRGIARPSRRGRTIAVEETIALGPNAYAAILRAGDRRLLVGITPYRVTVLASFDDRSE